MNSDGTPMLSTPIDDARQRSVADSLERAWNCKLFSFGFLAPIDYYVIKHERLVSVVEIKSRTHPHDKFPTVYLNVRKWLALTLAANGLGVKPIFVAHFTDGIYFVDVNKIDASKVEIGGEKRIFFSNRDIEPVILVPVDGMTMVDVGSRSPTGLGALGV